MDDNSSVVVEYSAGMNLTNPSKQTLKENAVGLLDYFDATIGKSTMDFFMELDGFQARCCCTSSNGLSTRTSTSR